MDNTELGVVVAERRLDVVRNDGTEHELLVRIGMPRPDPREGGDWECPGQMLGLGDEKLHRAYGVDALQAFILCLQLLDGLIRKRVHELFVFSAEPDGLAGSWASSHARGAGYHLTGSSIKLRPCGTRG